LPDFFLIFLLVFIGSRSKHRNGNDPDEPQIVPIDGNQSPSALQLSSPGTSGTSNPQQNSAKRQKVMFERYFDRISKEEKAVLDEHLAKAI